MKPTDNDPGFWDRWTVNDADKDTGLVEMGLALAVFTLFLIAVFLWAVLDKPIAA